MRIGILTHPLVNNYGGILQAFALQRALELMGHSPYIIDRRSDDYTIKRFIRKCLQILHLKRNDKITTYPQSRFIRSFIKTTRSVYNNAQLVRIIKKLSFEALIFGSDQIWRADFNRHFSFAFWGAFLEKVQPIRSISYAASISDDVWSYSQCESVEIKRYISHFSSISVREEKAIQLCKDNLGIITTLVLDPTLLHNKEFYSKYAIKNQETDPYVFVYWLGDENELNVLLNKLPDNMNIVRVSLRDSTTFIGVQEWLGLISEATTVVTDSFHGIVFSIIFEKQFICSKNQSGGVSRLYTIFKSLGIEKKFDNPTLTIDYAVVNDRLVQLRKESYNFLKSSLR